MPSAIGHSFVGYILSRQVFGEDHTRYHRSLICVLVSNLPDLDFIPGVLTGQPNLYHHAISHSLGAGLLASLVLATILGNKLRMPVFSCFVLLLGLYCGHLLLDYLSADGRSPFGIPAFWPLSDNYFIAPYPILPGFAHSRLDHATMKQFLSSVISMHNVYVVLIELCLGLLLLILLGIINDLCKSKKCIRNKTCN